MLTIRIDAETKKMIAYFRLRKVRFQPKLRAVIKSELDIICKDFNRKEKEIDMPF